MSFLTTITDDIGTEALGLSKSFWAEIKPVLENSAQTLLDQAVTAAIPVVTELETGTLDSTAKKLAAVEQVGKTLLADGKTVATNILNLAVEFAVAKIKPLAASTATTTTPAS